jgi:hypothetical protein
VTDRTSWAEIDLIKKLAALADVIIVNGFIRVYHTRARLI